MLRDGPYPWQLKQRVGGDYGHLNNEQAADLLTSIDLNRLKTLIISHISERNNQPELALKAVNARLQGWSGELVVADQRAGLIWSSIG